MIIDTTRPDPGVRGARAYSDDVVHRFRHAVHPFRTMPSTLEARRSVTALGNRGRATGSPAARSKMRYRSTTGRHQGSRTTDPPPATRSARQADGSGPHPEVPPAWAFPIRAAPDVPPILAERDPANGSFLATRRHDTLLEASIGDGLIIENEPTPRMAVRRFGVDAMR